HADFDHAWCMQFGPCLADAEAVDSRRIRLVRALEKQRCAIEVDERVHVEHARRLEAPHALLANADRLELLAHGKGDEGGLTDARLDLDDMCRRRVSHTGS